MLDRVPSWPKALAALVGGLGFSVLFLAWPIRFGGGDMWLSFDSSAVVVAALLFALSYLLATGRDWARRILLGLVIVIGLFFVFRYGTRAILPIYVTDLGPEKAAAFRMSEHLGYFSSLFLVLSVLVFSVLFLCHPNVVRSFRVRSEVKDDPDSGRSARSAR